MKQEGKPHIERDVLAAIEAWVLAMILAFWAPLALLVYWLWLR